MGGEVDEPAKMPSGRLAAPISAVITLRAGSCAGSAGVIPTARSIPSSRVRSKTDSASVFTIPKRLMITERASRT